MSKNSQSVLNRVATDINSIKQGELAFAARSFPTPSGRTEPLLQADTYLQKVVVYSNRKSADLHTHLNHIAQFASGVFESVDPMKVGDWLLKQTESAALMRAKQIKAMEDERDAMVDIIKLVSSIFKAELSTRGIAVDDYAHFHIFNDWSISGCKAYKGAGMPFGSGDPMMDEIMRASGGRVYSIDLTGLGEDTSLEEVVLGSRLADFLRGQPSGRHGHGHDRRRHTHAGHDDHGHG